MCMVEAILSDERGCGFVIGGKGRNEGQISTTRTRMGLYLGIQGLKLQVDSLFSCNLNHREQKSSYRRSESGIIRLFMLMA